MDEISEKVTDLDVTRCEKTRVKDIEDDLKEKKIQDRDIHDRMGNQIMIMENYMENYVPVQVENMIIENFRHVCNEEEMTKLRGEENKLYSSL